VQLSCTDYRFKLCHEGEMISRACKEIQNFEDFFVVVGPGEFVIQQAKVYSCEIQNQMDLCFITRRMERLYRARNKKIK